MIHLRKTCAGASLKCRVRFVPSASSISRSWMVSPHHQGAVVAAHVVSRSKATRTAALDGDRALPDVALDVDVDVGRVALEDGRDAIDDGLHLQNRRLWAR